jgi:ubiquitin C-terminal hydrolase
MILNDNSHVEIHKQSQKENLETKITPSISSSTSSSSTSSINIQKSYHKKDVLASVNNTFDNKKKAYDQINDYKLSNIVGSSCISFLDNKLTKMNNRNQQFYTHNLELLSKKLRKLLPFNNGLKNHGNTCFMNCILQCLFHTSPICEYIVAGQVERDIQLINGQRYLNRFNITNDNNNNNNNNNNEQNNTNPFILTRSFQRLLISMWKNTYDSSFSSELKQIIGYLNPTFAGVNQNDSHEFCVWFLDRLSQELTYRIPTSNLDKHTVNSSNKKLPITGSFIEELVQVKFKSTVVCSKCQYKSSKYETDMMLSIPLPQYQQSSKLNNKSTSSINSNIPLRRSLYIHLILTNPTSIKSLLMNANGDLNENSLFAPFHSKIAVNVHISNDSSYTRESFISYGNTNYSNNNGTVINPNFADLRRYIESAYQLAQSNLVFLDINNIRENLNDTQSVKQNFLNQNDPSLPFLNSSDSITIIELNHMPQMNQMPLINIICINVYYQQHNQSKKCFFYGLPFVLLINRDCSYSELCKKVLESQSKLFKDKNILKYNHLAEKFFTLSLVDSTTKLTTKINPTDELPLYAEFIDKALNESLNLSRNLPNKLEYIKLNIEWRSYEDIHNLFKDIDYSKAEFVHRSVRYLQTIDENELIQQQKQNQQQQSTNNENQMLTTTTLDDCFDLFTQCEELTDENSWMCPKCKKQTNAYKKLCISSVPPVLIIHLKRFFYRSKTSNFKLTTPVWFPVTGLDMSKYIEKNKNQNDQNSNLNSDDNDEDDNDDENNIGDYIETKMNNSGGGSRQRPYIYDLFAVCNHKGQNMANGHYTGIF